MAAQGPARWAALPEGGRLPCVAASLGRRTSRERRSPTVMVAPLQVPEKTQVWETFHRSTRWWESAPVLGWDCGRRLPTTGAGQVQNQVLPFPRGQRAVRPPAPATAVAPGPGDVRPPPLPQRQPPAAILLRRRQAARRREPVPWAPPPAGGGARWSAGTPPRHDEEQGAVELLPAARRAALGRRLGGWEAAAVQRLPLESRGAAAEGEGVGRHHGGGGGGRDSGAAAQEVSGSPGAGVAAPALSCGQGGTEPRWAERCLPPGARPEERCLPDLPPSEPGWRPGDGEPGQGDAALRTCSERGGGGSLDRRHRCPAGWVRRGSGAGGGEPCRRQRDRAGAGERPLGKVRRWARCRGPASPGCGPERGGTRRLSPALPRPLRWVPAARGARAAPARGAEGAAGVGDKSQLVPAPEGLGAGRCHRTGERNPGGKKSAPFPRRPPSGGAAVSRELTGKHAAVALGEEGVV